MSRQVESIIIRLERAGGALSEADKLAYQSGGIPGPLADRIAKVNIAVSDLRRAIVRYEHGEAIGPILNRLDAQMKEVGNV